MVNFPPEVCRPAAAKGRLYYVNSGRPDGPFLYYIYNDGSTDLRGTEKRRFGRGGGWFGCSFGRAYLAGSPDGKWVYAVGGVHGSGRLTQVVFRGAADGDDNGEVFAGTLGEPGSDNAHLNSPCSVDCDAQGRVYICDSLNQRVQVLSSGGKYAGTLKVERPVWVGVHRKTGAVYVVHRGTVRGKSVNRVTKFSPFPEMREIARFDGAVPPDEYSRFYLGKDFVGALDSWSARPRLWMGGGPYSVSIWEERGGSLEKISDFRREAKKEAGSNYMGPWSGTIRRNVTCDPLRGHVYYYASSGRSAMVFDIGTGRLLREMRFSGQTDDIAFGKRGYVHEHFYPTYQGGVGRFDPDRAAPIHVHGRSKDLKHVPFVRPPEVPYDYGVVSQSEDLTGVLPTKDPPHRQKFKDGIGVNMRGDIAVILDFYYQPKGFDLSEWGALGTFRKANLRRHEMAKRLFLEASKRGEEMYYIRSLPGIPLRGATIWTFDRSGELRQDCAVIAGGIVNGVQIDEDGKLYFAVNRPRLYEEKPFLAGKAGIIGSTDPKKRALDPFTGTFIKSRAKNVRMLLKKGSRIPLEQPPARPLEVSGYYYEGGPCWVEGAKWFYAGASPIIRIDPCRCPQMRSSTDWYKRSFVPEAYRHSIGVLDTNGNLIMHIGTYGNLDSGNGPKSAIPVGGDGIGVTYLEYLSATDDYLCFQDNTERLVVLRLEYHAEETVAVRAN
jgi:hypothetical protein